MGYLIPHDKFNLANLAKLFLSPTHARLPEARVLTQYLAQKPAYRASKPAANTRVSTVEY